MFCSLSIILCLLGPSRSLSLAPWGSGIIKLILWLLLLLLLILAAFLIEAGLQICERFHGLLLFFKSTDLELTNVHFVLLLALIGFVFNSLPDLLLHYVEFFISVLVQLFYEGEGQLQFL